MYQGIFDTDFDKYLEDAVALFIKTGITTVFVNLEGWPEDWRTNVPAVYQILSGIISVRASWNTGSIPRQPAERSRRRVKVKTAFRHPARPDAIAELFFTRLWERSRRHLAAIAWDFRSI